MPRRRRRQTTNSSQMLLLTLNHWRHGYVPCTVTQLEWRHRIHSRSRLSGAKMHAISGPAISFFFVATHRSLHWRHNILRITSSLHRNQYYAAPVNVLRFRCTIHELRHFCYCGWVYSARWAPTWAERFPFQLLFLCRFFCIASKNSLLSLLRHGQK